VRWFLVFAGSACALTFALLHLAVWLEPLPPALREAPTGSGLEVLDRSGQRLALVHAPDRLHALAITDEEVPAELKDALIAAEDARFRQHAGVDVLAIGRAIGQLVWQRRVVSGASTLTQQLARSLVPRPRTLRGKLKEVVVALRIERELDKNQILTAYANHVAFGPNVRGVEAAARLYFDKPAARLSLAEAAALAAMVRGPSFYDPTREGRARLTTRRNWVLSRVERLGLRSSEAVERAQALPVELKRPTLTEGVEHLVRALARRRVHAELRELGPLRRIETTLDLGLQREVEALARSAQVRLAAVDASAIAILVVENESADVLAYVGSPDFHNADALGQNDGALALRQPGSALKPFVYAAAIETLGFTAGTLLPDIALHLPTQAGDYAPRNYSGRFHGPVRLREALASSLNVPAVVTADRLGARATVEWLRRFGFASLDRDPMHYGAAVALGDGEVRLSELAEAYRALARGGLTRKLRFARSLETVSGERQEIALAEERRVCRSETALLVSHILADDAARALGFGRHSVLELPFPASVKTGTSKSFRDNVTVGYTADLTVAVWVGNFDGKPMRGSSGVTGAAPLFRDVLLAATRRRGSEPAPPDTSRFVRRSICPLSGKLAGPECPHQMDELFIPAHVPSARCDLHERVAIDPENGLRAGLGCPHTIEKVFERFPPEYMQWVATARRTVAPSEYSARCPGPALTHERSSQNGAPAVTYPVAGARFVLDPHLSREQQVLSIRARAPAGTPALVLRLDGREHSVLPPFVYRYPLERGRHSVRACTRAGVCSEPVEFVVE
jgi:penicillin-binding protein 1C